MPPSPGLDPEQVFGPDWALRWRSGDWSHPSDRAMKGKITRIVVVGAHARRPDLARALAVALTLPLFEFEPVAGPVSPAERDRRHRVVGLACWVIDGNADNLADRLLRCELAILFDRPLLARIMARASERGHPESSAPTLKVVRMHCRMCEVAPIIVRIASWRTAQELLDTIALDPNGSTVQ